MAGLNSTILYYTMRKTSLTSELGMVMGRMNNASAESEELMTRVNSKRAYYTKVAIDNPSYALSSEYAFLTSQLEQEYQASMADVQSWEVELEMQKSNVETELAVITSAEEGWAKMLGGNIKKDQGYFSSGQ